MSVVNPYWVYAKYHHQYIINLSKIPKSLKESEVDDWVKSHCYLLDPSDETSLNQNIALSKKKRDINYANYLSEVYQVSVNIKPRVKAKIKKQTDQSSNVYQLTDSFLISLVGRPVVKLAKGQEMTYLTLPQIIDSYLKVTEPI